MIPAGTPADQQDLMYFMIAATWPDQIKDKNSGYIDDGPGGGNILRQGLQRGKTQDMAIKARHKYWHFIDTPFTQDGTTAASGDPVAKRGN